MAGRETLPIRVNHPRRLPAWSLPAERVPIGPGYKPSMALLPDGTLVMVALYMHMGIPEEGIPEEEDIKWYVWDENLPPGKLREWTGIWRSKDGGRTWTDREYVQDMIGREQWLTCTSDGTLFASSHLLERDMNNDEGHCTSWLHRSRDGGRTWDRTRATPDGRLRRGVPRRHASVTSRNVVELPNGTLLLGVSINSSDVAYLWRSTDKGDTWEQDRPVTVQGWCNPHNGFFAEDFTYLDDSGKLLHWCRIAPLYYRGSAPAMLPMGDERVVPTGDDSINRMMMTRSLDDGLTWSPLKNFGDYASHYPRVLRLRDGRLLLTYTQRGFLYPIGLRAILSCDDGETWDFNYDQIVIEGFTPWGREGGGGFGNTLQLADGTLISCYSYRGDDDCTHIEVVRWRLP